MVFPIHAHLFQDILIHINSIQTDSFRSCSGSIYRNQPQFILIHINLTQSISSYLCLIQSVSYSPPLQGKKKFILHLWSVQAIWPLFFPRRKRPRWLGWPGDGELVTIFSLGVFSVESYIKVWNHVLHFVILCDSGFWGIPLKIYQ